MSNIGGGAVNHLAVALLLFAALPSAIANGGTNEADKTEFVAGNLVFVMLHEFSHVVIDDFDIPVFGNGEDAADTLLRRLLLYQARRIPRRHRWIFQSISVLFLHS